MDHSLIDQIEKEHKIYKLSPDEHIKWLYDLYFQTQEKIARVRADIHRQKVEDENDRIRNKFDKHSDFFDHGAY